MGGYTQGIHLYSQYSVSYKVYVHMPAHHEYMLVQTLVTQIIPYFLWRRVTPHIF